MTFNFSPEARQDLIDIHTYIAADNPQAAAKVIDGMFAAMAKLAKRPRMGHVRRDLTDRDVRFWTSGGYLIIYEANTLPIGIVRILSGYRDIAAMLE